MITIEDVIAKVVAFICLKVATQIPKLLPDKRRKACRALTKLYYCVQALDDVTESIFQTTSEFRSTKTGEAFAIVDALPLHMHEVALATNMFLDLGHELHAGLEIIDPALAQCCDALYVSKFDFLSEMSETLEWNSQAGEEARIVVKMPRRTVEREVLERSYAECVEAFRRGDKCYWPDTWTKSDGPDQVILAWEDSATAEAFLHRLKEHRESLVDAKEKLRQLLKASFTVDELLFQNDSHPYR